MKIKQLLLYFALTVLIPSPAQGAEASEAAWSAHWIGLPTVAEASGEPAERNQTPANTWCCFRGRLSLNAKPRVASARIACDSKYWLWINGKLVVFEGQLKRGPTPEDTYFDRVDLKQYLRAGENVAALLVWHFGKHGMSHNNSGKLGLLFEADIDAQKFVSDGSWRVLRHPAHQNTGKPHPNWRLPESNIKFDARQDIGAWQNNEFDDSTWSRPEVYGAPPTPPWNKLHERSIPQWQTSEIRPYEKIETTDENGIRKYVAKLPYNAQITPYLKADAPAGKLIEIRTDNYRGGGEPNIRSEYITKAGLQEYESLGWMNGHDVHYRIPPEVSVVELGYRESGYGCEFAGSFECNDPFLNQLWKKSQRTLYLEMRDGFVDCPGRERAQWWGDITLELQQTFYGLDPDSHKLSRKAIRELVDWRKDDGTIFSPIPAGNWDKELPMQMLASVGRYGFWTYYLHTGDRATIEHAYPTVKNYVLNVWQLGEDGLVVQRQGGWTWGDWGQNKDMPLLYNAWYYLALDSVASMAKLLGHDDDLQEAETRMASIQQQFNKQFWTGTEYRSPDYQGPTDDRGQALAVVSHLAKPEQYSQIRKILKEQLHASPYMEKYVLQALFEMGFSEDAYARMKQRYRKMVESELTTLWEGWGIGTEGFGGGSYNHAWSGGPLILLSKYASGIAPLYPGYKQFRVRPMLGPLNHVTTRVSTAAGVIEVDVRQNANAYNLVVDVPEATVAQLSVPTKFAEEISINDKRVDTTNSEAGYVEGVKSISTEKGYIVLEVESGHWQLEGIANTPAAK